MLIDGCMHPRMDESKDGCTYGWMDAYTNGWIDEYTYGGQINKLLG